MHQQSVFLLACMALVGHTRRTQISAALIDSSTLADSVQPTLQANAVPLSGSQKFVSDEGKFSQLKVLAVLLRALNPLAALNLASLRTRVAMSSLSPTMSRTAEIMMTLPPASILKGLPVPAALCAEDGRIADAPPEDLFTLDTITARMPKIIDSVIETLPEALASNSELLDGLGKLQVEMRDGAPLQLLKGTSERVGADAWNQDLAGPVAAGQTWHTAPWWLVENYMYKRILEELDKIGESASSYDPFAPSKSKSIAAAASMIDVSVQPLLKLFTAAETTSEDHAEKHSALKAGLLRSLWGNQADLSLSAGKVGDDVADSGGQIITDNIDSAVDLLLGARGRPVIIVLDNHGPEVLSDLILVDALIRVAGVSSVSLHVKDAPVFVSDVTKDDIEGILDWVDDQASDFGKRLRGWLETGKLDVVPSSFYTTARFFWQLPGELKSKYQEAAVVILKGDANYRRLLADLHWDYDTSFEEYAKTFWPSEGLVSLRTMKSGVALGISKEKQAEARADHPNDWLTCGVYGQVLASRQEVA